MTQYDFGQVAWLPINKGFSIAGVPCSADTFEQSGSSVLHMKFCAKTPTIANPRSVEGDQAYLGFVRFGFHDRGSARPSRGEHGVDPFTADTGCVVGCRDNGEQR